MSVFRIERTKDYTVMSNHHLRDKRLSLKAKGLLSQMLSLPEDWDYTLSGLAYINLESKDAIRSAVNELETTGYIQRHQTVKANGKFGANEYVIYEKPQPSSDKPLSENPTTEKPSTEITSSENPTQLNTKITNIKKQNTDLSNTHSILSAESDCESDKFSASTIHEPKEPKRNEITLAQMNHCRDDVKERIEYETLAEQYPGNDYLETIVELMVETLCSAKRNIRVAGDELPAEVVKERLMQVDSEIVGFVLDCLKMNTTKVRNIRQYLLTTLYNAPVTIGSHFTSLVNHDLYGTDD